jgi:hypothetical protein
MVILCYTFANGAAPLFLEYFSIRILMMKCTMREFEHVTISPCPCLQTRNLVNLVRNSEISFQTQTNFFLKGAFHPFLRIQKNNSPDADTERPGRDFLAAKLKKKSPSVGIIS